MGPGLRREDEKGAGLHRHELEHPLELQQLALFT
jgi:hypothetical protein